MQTNPAANKNFFILVYPSFQIIKAIASVIILYLTCLRNSIIFSDNSQEKEEGGRGGDRGRFLCLPICSVKEEAVAKHYFSEQTFINPYTARNENNVDIL
jgi:hypothetical protein